MANVSLEKLLLHFSQCMKSDGKSPATITWYNEMIPRFLNFLEANNKKPVLSEFNIEVSSDFVIYEQERNLSPLTIQARVRAL